MTPMENVVEPQYEVTIALCLKIDDAWKPQLMECRFVFYVYTESSLIKTPRGCKILE
jgi:hypothetical protein